MEQDRRYWIALNLVPGIGSLAYRNLVSVFQEPREIFKASERRLRSVEGVGPKLIEAIQSFPVEKRLKNELNRMERYEVSVLSYQDSGYPYRLLAIYDPPPVLYVRGRLEPRDEMAVAIVGSRMATRHGKSLTERLARDLAVRGITVVSGLARGVDSAAHRGALIGRGRTIAVLGCGVDVIYPAENRTVMEKIVCHGAVISEFPMGTPPCAGNFPRRNRIISGLVRGVVVVEATDRSGSLITANYALEQGREVLAVPGSVGLANSQGTNRLLKQGARLVEGVEDILEEILPQGLNPGYPNADVNLLEPDLSDEEQMIYSLLGNDPVHIDHLIRQTHWTASRVAGILLDLELAGMISQVAGKQFVRVS